MSDTVIILHGLGRSSISMRRLARAVANAGYNPVCLDYSPKHRSLAALSDDLSAGLPKTGRIHFIGHSMGGVLALRIAHGLPADRRGRIVQLGAPNQGSALAARAAQLLPFPSPALAALIQAQPAPASDLEIGSIAGSAAWPIYGLITGLEGANDGKVAVTSAHGDAQHRLTLPLAHSTMMKAPAAIAACITFLDTGHF